MLFKEFVTAGKATFTVEIPAWFAAEHGTAPHYTYRVNRKDADDRGPAIYFAALLTGPNNERDYTYLGTLFPTTGKLHLTRASKLPADSWPVRVLGRVLARLWAGQADAITAAGWDLHHEGQGCRCGRALTTPASVTAGIGPECAKHVF